MTSIEQGSKSFSFGLLFLPIRYRQPIKELYSYCRYVDDLVDLEASADPSAKLWELYNSKELDSFFETYSIDKVYFAELIKGVESDIDHKNYQTFEDLYDYCYKVGGTVGIMLTQLFGVNNSTTFKYAEYIGVGMQLTNILRDLKQDQLLNRMYLPLQDLERYGVTGQDFANGDLPKVRELIKEYVSIADSYFEKGLAGVNLLPHECRIGILISIGVYRQILREIENRDYDVFSARVYTTKYQKALVACKVLAKNLGTSLNYIIRYAS
jgi:phytoene synthase